MSNLYGSITVAVLTAGGCAGEQKPPDQVTIQRKWIHQAQFAGMYVAEKKEEVREKPSHGNGKILVVDDDEIIRNMLCKILPIVGYQVEPAKEGDEAIRKYTEARKAGQPFNAVIMDLTIPGGLGGKEAIKKLLEIDPDARVIVSSGYATDSIMSEYEDYGFSAVLTKPYNVGQLEEMLNDVLADKSDGNR